MRQRQWTRRAPPSEQHALRPATQPTPFCWHLQSNSQNSQEITEDADPTADSSLIGMTYHKFLKPRALNIYLTILLRL